MIVQLMMIGICVIVTAVGIETLRSNWHLLNVQTKVLAGGMITMGIIILMSVALKTLLTLSQSLLQ